MILAVFVDGAGRRCAWVRGCVVARRGMTSAEPMAADRSELCPGKQQHDDTDPRDRSAAPTSRGMISAETMAADRGMISAETMVADRRHNQRRDGGSGPRHDQRRDDGCRPGHDQRRDHGCRPGGTTAALYILGVQERTIGWCVSWCAMTAVSAAGHEE
jgi:hypothetical protein